jgi:hypothetical protein
VQQGSDIRRRFEISKEFSVFGLAAWINHAAGLFKKIVQNSEQLFVLGTLYRRGGDIMKKW